ncbi:GDSL esterase/lipase At1g29670-like [Prosopis cineraria]|uniref:GDSL esterase/lipase At1g29670-like n=1 Tax=Prosopis cineraria TaxID=364024 RepID=UPI0024108562|nr:GDSL esterase/lipase At1g29670-like [Prosopis cineraria]
MSYCWKRKQWLVLRGVVMLGATIWMVEGEPQVPCIFIFGDSLSDNGNNHALPTSAKANYFPYGIDFPGGKPTGRFTNGLNSVDFITQFLGFDKLIPPFANTAADISKGVNYASGAAGIRNETGKHLGSDINLGLQLTNHRTTVSQISAGLNKSSEKVEQLLNKCLYYVNIGSNDYLNNYFLPQYYPTSTSFTLDHYASDLIRQYSHIIRSLYDIGGRKFVLVGMGYIGSTPRALTTLETNSSVDDINKAAFIFNSNLKSQVDRFNKALPNASFIFINSTVSKVDPSLGFKVLDSGCCQVGENGQCVANARPFENRKDFVFFDSFHPTEAVNLLIAISSYNASIPGFTYPMNISQLVRS